MNSDIKKLKSGMIWKTISTAMCIFTGFVLSVIFARSLGKEIYGELIIVYTVVSLFVLLCNFGLDSALRRFVPLYTKKDHEKKFGVFLFTIFGLGLAFTTFFSVSMFLLSGFISSDIFHKPWLAVYMRWGALYLFTFSIFYNIVLPIYHGFQKWKEESFLNLAYLVGSSIPIFIVLTIFHKGILEVIKINAAACFLCASAGLFYIAKFIGPVKTPLELDEFTSQTKETLSFSAPLLINSLLFYFIMQLDRVILGIYRPMDELAQYHVALALGVGIVTFFKVAEIVFTPYLAKLTGETGQLIKSKFEAIFRLFLHSAVILSICLYFIIGPFIRFVYGPNFELAVVILKVYLILVVLRAAMTPVGLFLVNVFGKTLEITKIGIVDSLIHLALFLILIPAYGYKGALATLVIAYMAIWVYAIIFIKEIRRMIPYKSLMRAVIGMALVLGINFAFRFFNVYNQWILFVILPLSYGSFVLLAEGIKLKNTKDAI